MHAPAWSFVPVYTIHMPYAISSMISKNCTPLMRGVGPQKIHYCPNPNNQPGTLTDRIATRIVYVVIKPTSRTARVILTIRGNGPYATGSTEMECRGLRKKFFGTATVGAGAYFKTHLAEVVNPCSISDAEMGRSAPYLRWLPKTETCWALIYLKT